MRRLVTSLLHETPLKCSKTGKTIAVQDKHVSIGWTVLESPKQNLEELRNPERLDFGSKL